MSDQTLDYDTASAVLFDQIFVPAYFRKLAACGVQPSSQEEAQKLLALADKVRYADELELSKGASAQTNLIDYANSAFDQALGLQSQAQPDPYVEKEAADLAQTPLLRDAALLYQDAIRQAGAV